MNKVASLMLYYLYYFYSFKFIAQNIYLTFSFENVLKQFSKVETQRFIFLCQILDSGILKKSWLKNSNRGIYQPETKDAYIIFAPSYVESTPC